MPQPEGSLLLSGNSPVTNELASSSVIAEATAVQHFETENPSMSQAPNESADNASSDDRSRRRQNRINLEIQAADAQKLAARIAIKSTRYMLWAVILATLSTFISMAGAVYVVWAHLPHAPQ